MFALITPTWAGGRRGGHADTPCTENTERQPDCAVRPTLTPNPRAIIDRPPADESDSCFPSKVRDPEDAAVAPAERKRERTRVRGLAEGRRRVNR